MKRVFGISTNVAFCVIAMASNVHATLIPFSTGFEAPEGYTNNTQLAATGGGNWTGYGQDTSNWLVTNQVLTGSGAKTGTQWVLASSPTTSTTRYQYTVNPVTDFSLYSAITGSVDVKFATSADGTNNRNVAIGIQMFDAYFDLIGSLVLIDDVENLAHLGANRLLAEIDFGDTNYVQYDLGVTTPLNTYFNLSMTTDFVANTVSGSINASPLPYIGSAGGFTDFHDCEMILARASFTSGGTALRGGFDNYAVSQTPEPATISMIAIGVFGLLRRRR